MAALWRNVPRQMAMEMLLLEHFLPSARVAELGLVNRVVPAEDVETAAMKMARIIADKSLSAVQIGKRAFYEQAEMALAEAYALDGRTMAENMMARDAEAGIGAFTCKELMPEWTANDFC